MGLTSYLREWAAKHGDRTALVFEKKRRSWTELADRVGRLASVLRDLGVEPGDRVAMLANSSDRYVEYYYGVLWLGAIVMPLNSRHAVPELLAQIHDAEPKVLLVDASFASVAGEIKAASPSIKHLIYADDGEIPQGMISYEKAIAAAKPCADTDAGDGNVACLFYTGGTTGRAKGVMLTHDNLMSSAQTMIGLLGVEDDSLTHLHAGPLFHLAAGGRLLMTTMVGGRHVVVPRFTPHDVLTIVQAERITALTLVPTMLSMILRQPDFDSFDLSSVRLITYGASPMPETLLREAMAKFPKVNFSQVYGMTELSPAATMLRPEDHREGPAHRLRSAGKAVTGVDLRVVDSEDNARPTGEVGEIIVRGPNVMKGYWRQPEQTEQALRNGWMHTGDAGYLDADGYLYVVDRTKDMIVSGGENVYSAEVENAVGQHPAVRQCAVIGIPSDKWGEAVHAVVVPREGQTVDPEEIIGHCRSLIAGYKCPRSVEVRQDDLPLSAVGKIDKVTLRAPHWQGRTRQVN
jgi:acyl-CoA synthetase (AMP-forming)/AMP-acid ligase II